MRNMKKRTRAISVGLAIVLVASAVAVGVMYGAPDASAVEWSTIRTRLGVAEPAAVKIATTDTVVLQTWSVPKQETKIEAPVAPRVTSTRPSSSTPTSSGSTTPSTGASTASELAQAQAILAGWIAKYPILAGSTVTIGATPNDYQAVCYYKSGRIVINPNHTASLSTILKHEVGHIIDWRDNGVIDWGENIPAL